MSVYKKYDRYKDSGVEWIGEVPEHWDVIPLKRLTTMVNRGISPTYVSESDIKIINQACIYWDGLRLENIKYQQNDIEPYTYKGNLVFGDVLVNSTGTGTLGRAQVFNLDEKYIADSHVTIVRTIYDNLNPKYLFFLLQTPYYQGFIYSAIVTGATNQIELSREGLRNTCIIHPTYKEQKAIADFLDQKTSEIDSLIADKEKLIELLQEKRQAIISEAVTKGLDKNVKMKDSGIDLIGEVPEHWEALPLKRIIKDFESGVSVNAIDELAEEGEYGILKTSCVFNDEFDPKENKVILDEVELRNARLNPKKDCIIISRMNTPELVGASGYVSEDHKNLFLPDRLWQTVYWNKENISCLWLSYVLNSHFFRGQVSSVATGTSDSMKNVSKNDYLSIIIVLPPFEEQTQIALALKSTLEIINQVEIEIKEIVTKLKEYRQSLISEAVTGKIMV